MFYMKIFDRYLTFIESFKERVPKINYHMNVIELTCLIKLGLKCIILSCDNITSMEERFNEIVNDFIDYQNELEKEERDDNAESNGKRS